jgi:hypothetical protein
VELKAVRPVYSNDYGREKSLPYGPSVHLNTKAKKWLPRTNEL